jgi:SAM-dependent methyltransferase
MDGLTAIELGCGTAYVSAWMARRGAAVVGIDNSERQLAVARRLAELHGLDLILLHGNAETVPYPDASFDFAISEYGAAIWCDPYVWIPEAHRLLAPGGRLVFLGSTPLASICTPPSGAACEPQLHRDYFGLHRLDWRHVAVDPGGIEFNLPISAWLRLFRETGFEVIDYVELRAPASASGTAFAMPAAWAKRWPSEHVWKLRKRA